MESASIFPVAPGSPLLDWESLISADLAAGNMDTDFFDDCLPWCVIPTACRGVIIRCRRTNCRILLFRLQDECPDEPLQQTESSGASFPQADSPLSTEPMSSGHSTSMPLAPASSSFVSWGPPKPVELSSARAGALRPGVHGAYHGSHAMSSAAVDRSFEGITSPTTFQAAPSYTGRQVTSSTAGPSASMSHLLYADDLLEAAACKRNGRGLGSGHSLSHVGVFKRDGSGSSGLSLGACGRTPCGGTPGGTPSPHLWTAKKTEPTSCNGASLADILNWFH